MKKYLFSVILFALSLSMVKAQDIDINIIPQLNGVNEGVWPLNATNARILITVCNNDGGATPVPQFKVRPVISIDPAICQIAANALQTGLPAGWSIVSNTGTTIRLCNGTDTWLPGECRSFTVLITPIAFGSGPVAAALNWANGISCSVSGPATPGNQTANDGSGSSVTVSGTVPITLMSFEGSVANCKSYLKWKVSKDSNTDKFDIEQSSDGNRFTTAGTITGVQSREDYDFAIAHPGQKMYYRLKMIDLDGKKTYSNIVQLTSACNNASETFRVYPNPVTSSVFRVEFSKSGNYELQLLNANGATVKQERLSVTAGQTVQISNVNYAAGTYILRITDGGNMTAKYTKLVIQ